MMNTAKGPLTPDARAREAQTKFMEEAVQKVQKYFGLLCNEFGGACRKSGHLRDKYDLVAKTCLDYANVEQGPLKQSLTKFAENLSSVQDYRQAEIERLEAKVVGPLSTYASECKHTQDDLNKSFKMRNRELKQHQKLENVRHNSPSNSQAITVAQAELQRRTLDVTRSTQNLQDTIDKFEVKKIRDLKQFLTDFVKIEMLFHAKAVEVFTLTFNELNSIDEEEHLEIFRNSLRIDTNMQERMDLARNTADGSPTNREHSTRKQTTNTPSPKSRNTMSKRLRERHDEFEDETEEDGEEDEEDEDWDSEEDMSEEETEEDEENAVEELQPRRARTKPW